MSEAKPYVLILAVVGAFGVMTGVRAAQPTPPRPGFSKVIISHGFGTANGTAPGLVDAVGGRIVSDYDTFLVATIPSEAVDALLHRAKQAATGVSVRDDYDLIMLPGGVIDARKGTRASNPGKQLGFPYRSGERGMYIVQFAAPLKAEWTQAMVLAGATPIQHIRENTWLVAATDREVTHIAAHPFVQFIDIFHPFLKPQTVVRAADPFPMYVQLANVAEAEDAVLELAARSRGPLTRAVYGESELRVRGTFLGDDVDVILNMPLVFGVSEIPYVQLSDERVANIIAGNVDANGAPTRPAGYKSWLDSSCGFCSNLLSDGFKVGIADTGLDGGTSGPHRSDLPTTRITWGHAFDASGQVISDSMQDPAANGHGTMVAGVAVGDGITSPGADGFYYAMGIAPSAGVFATKPLIPASWTSASDPTPAYTPIPVSANDARSSSVFIQNFSQNQYTTSNNPSGAPPGVCLWTGYMFYDGSYSIFSREFDQSVIDSDANPSTTLTPITLTVSAGNKHQTRANPTADDSCGDLSHNGGIRRRLTLPPATAKNVIAVGASESVRPANDQWRCWGSSALGINNIENDSKRGTRNANWFKPDLFAPAAGISSLRSSEVLDTSSSQLCFATYGATPTGPLPAAPFMGSSGTSFAAPVAAGAALLASRVFAEVKAPLCAATTCDPGAASPALLKAMLVMSAQSMRGGVDKADSVQDGVDGTTMIGSLPNGQQGFGRISLVDMLKPYPARVYVNEDASTAHQGGLATGEEWNDTYTIQDGTLPVKVVLTWTDPPALQTSGTDQTAVTSSPLLNDLNLAVDLVATPCTTRYIGNVTTFVTQSRGEESQVFDCSKLGTDNSNNVELVKFFADGGTQFKVHVTGQSVGATASQTFALVVYNGYRSAGTAPPSAAVTGLQAKSDTTPRVVLTWNSVTGATAYDIQRKKLAPAPGDTLFTNTASVGSSSYTDASVSSGATYLYRVRARNSAGMTNYCTPDVVYLMTTAFTDDPLVAFSDVPQPPVSSLTKVKAVHIIELRAAVNQLRAAVALDAANYTNADASLLNSYIASVDITELRAALDQARAAAGAFALIYSDGSNLSLLPIKGAHIRQLREGVR